MKPKFIIVIAVILAIVLAAGAYTFFFSGVPVEVAAAKYGSLTARLSTDGVVDSIKVELAPEISGRMVDIYVEEGDAVTSGEQLVRITDEQAAAAVNEAKAAYEVASTQVDIARANLQKIRTHSGAQIAAAGASERVQQAQLEKAKTGSRKQEIRQAEAGVQAAKAEVEAATAALEAAHSAAEQTRAQYEARLSGAQAGLNAARSQLQKARKGPRDQEVAQARAALEAVQARAENATAHFERIQTLYRQGATSEAQLDDARTAKRAAVSARDEAAETLAILEEGTRPEDIQAAEAQVEQAQATLREAQALQKTVAVREKEVKVAEARITQAQANLQESQEYASLVREGTRIEDIRSQQERLAMAEAESRAATASRSDVQAAAHRLQQAIAERDRATAALESARANLSDTIVTSPITGSVARRYLDEGAMVGPQTPILSLVNNRDVWVIARVDDEDISRVRDGQTVQVLMEAYPDRKMEGEIIRIGEAAEPKGEGRVRAKIIRVKIQVEGAADILKPGMEVDIQTDATIKSRTLLIPADAVVEEPEGSFVWAVENGRAHKRQIETGFSSYTETEITSGLTEGDRVVVSGKDELEDGIRVTVGESATEQKLEAQ